MFYASIQLTKGYECTYSGLGFRCIVIPNTFPSFVPVASSSPMSWRNLHWWNFSENIPMDSCIFYHQYIHMISSVSNQICVHCTCLKKLCPHSICWLYDWPLHQWQLASACRVSFSLPRYFGQVLQCTRGYCLFRFARIVLHRPKNGLMWWEAFLEHGLKQKKMRFA